MRRCPAARTSDPSDRDRARAASLRKLGLPSTESKTRAMVRALGVAEDASVAYGEFRRFAVLMPRDKLLRESEASIAWFESATCVPVGGARLALVCVCFRMSCHGADATSCPLQRCSTPPVQHVMMLRSSCLVQHVGSAAALT
jgi:hypothetical protein